MLVWFNKFKKSNFRGFEGDRRGCHKNDAFIADSNLTDMFKFYMKTANNLSIELTKKNIELDLVKDLQEYGFQIPLVKATVYRRMRKNGASYSTAKTCYDNDRHNTLVCNIH